MHVDNTSLSDSITIFRSFVLCFKYKEIIFSLKGSKDIKLLSEESIKALITLTFEQRLDRTTSTSLSS